MHRCRSAGLVLAAALASPSAPAQDWPAKPVRFIAGSTPGSVGDVVLRILGEQFQKQTGQPWILDYRPGAGASIAAVATAKSTPDGYTYGLINTGTIAISPYVFAQPPYDAMKDFTYVARMVQLSTVLWVRKDSPFASVTELVEFARANPGKLNYASTGPGAVSHLGGVLLGLRSGTSSVHVPYKSTAASSTAVLSGEADFGFESLATALGHIRAGTARALGVAGRGAPRDAARRSDPRRGGGAGRRAHFLLRGDRASGGAAPDRRSDGGSAQGGARRPGDGEAAGGPDLRRRLVRAR